MTVLLTRHSSKLQYICDCAGELARAQLHGLFTYENALTIAEKSAAAQTEHLIEWIQAYVDTGQVNNTGYLAPSAIYQLLEDLRSALKPEAGAPETPGRERAPSRRPLPQSRHMVVNVIVYGSLVLGFGALGALLAAWAVAVISWGAPRIFEQYPVLDVIIIAASTSGMIMGALRVLAHSDYAEKTEAHKENGG